MRPVLIVGNTFSAWRFAGDAARGGATVRFLVPPGAPDAMAPVFDRSVEWPCVYDLPRYAVVDGKRLQLPLDPLDVMRAIGPGAWALDAAALARRKLRHRSSATVGDVARRDLGRRLADRYALRWLAARYGSEDAPANALDARMAVGWIRLSDGESTVRDAIWGAGGDVVEDVHVTGVERVLVNGVEQVVAIETEHGLEHVDGSLFVDEVDPNRLEIAEYDGADAVVDYASPVDSVWREILHDGAVFRFGPSVSTVRIIPALANVRAIERGMLPIPALLPTDPFPG